jgi:hypothetical protein
MGKGIQRHQTKSLPKPPLAGHLPVEYSNKTGKYACLTSDYASNPHVAIRRN